MTKISHIWGSVRSMCFQMGGACKKHAEAHGSWVKIYRKWEHVICEEFREELEEDKEDKVKKINLLGVSSNPIRR